MVCTLTVFIILAVVAEVMSGTLRDPSIRAALQESIDKTMTKINVVSTFREPCTSWPCTHVSRPLKDNCHQKCGYLFWRRVGKCQLNGRCLCWWGWTGPNSEYIHGGPFHNRILADYCVKPCNFTFNNKNPQCSTKMKMFLHMSNIESKATTISTPISTLPSTESRETNSNPTTIVLRTYDSRNEFYHPKRCHEKCSYLFWHITGKCRSDGRCLCWWGWTGPNAKYIDGGLLNNRILADYCIQPCHFTHDFRNPLCAVGTKSRSHTSTISTIVTGINSTATIRPSMQATITTTPRKSLACTVIVSATPATNLMKTKTTAQTIYPSVTSTPLPKEKMCHSKCSYSFWHIAGECQKDGRCLCWWGWTGPNAKYIDGGPLNNRILADYCIKTCHFTHDYRNPKCANTTVTIPVIPTSTFSLKNMTIFPTTSPLSSTQSLRIHRTISTVTRPLSMVMPLTMFSSLLSIPTSSVKSPSISKTITLTDLRTPMTTSSTKKASQTPTVISSSTKKVSSTTVTISSSTEKISPTPTTTLSSSTKVLSTSTTISSSSAKVSPTSTTISSSSKKVSSTPTTISSSTMKVLPTSTATSSSSTKVSSTSTTISSSSKKVSPTPITTSSNTKNVSPTLTTTSSSTMKVSLTPTTTSSSTKKVSATPTITTSSTMKVSPTPTTTSSSTKIVPVTPKITTSSTKIVSPTPTTTSTSSKADPQTPSITLTTSRKISSFTLSIQPSSITFSLPTPILQINSMIVSSSNSRLSSIMLSKPSSEIQTSTMIFSMPSSSSQITSIIMSPLSSTEMTSSMISQTFSSSMLIDITSMLSSISDITSVLSTVIPVTTLTTTELMPTILTSSLIPIISTITFSSMNLETSIKTPEVETTLISSLFSISSSNVIDDVSTSVISSVSSIETIISSETPSLTIVNTFAMSSFELSEVLDTTSVISISPSTSISSSMVMVSSMVITEPPPTTTPTTTAGRPAPPTA